MELKTWVILCMCVIQSSPVRTDVGDYVNGFLVEVENFDVAKEVAKDLGFKIDNKLENLGLYYFIHNDIPRRSKRSAEDYANKLSEDTRVSFVEQQQILHRVRRSIIYDKQIELPNREVDENSDLFRVEPDRLTSRSKNDDDMGYNDPYYHKQWYIRNTGQSDGTPGVDLNVIPAWKRGVTGKNVTVTILDDGIDHTHPDLINRYDSRASADFDDKFDLLDDPTPDKRDKSNSHGTRCAGEVAAEADNHVCGVGIAHECNIGGIRLLDGSVTDNLEAQAILHENQYVHIYSASWGPNDDGATMEGPRTITSRALAEGAKNGRGGLGSIFVWATGNGGDFDDDCSADGYVSDVHTLSVGSVNDRGKKPYFMEECSSTLAVVPSGGEVYQGEENGMPKIKTVTTDLNGKCTLTFEGTSAAAPLAAGCIALLLQANPQLTWRDVQYITAEAARIPNIDDDSWKVNGADYHTSHRYGFGLMDCGYMVELGQKWHNIPKQQICTTDMQHVNRIIPSDQCETFSIDMSQCIFETDKDIDQLEHVQIHIKMDHSRRGDVEIFLKSPRDTISKMLSSRLNDNSKDGISFLFTTIHNWGESPVGTWDLIVCDRPGKSSRVNRGLLKSWSLRLYGTTKHKHTRKNIIPHTPNREERVKIMEREKMRSITVDINEESGTPIKKGDALPIDDDIENSWNGMMKGFPTVLQNRAISDQKRKHSGDTRNEVKGLSTDNVNQLLDDLIDEIDSQVQASKNTRLVKNRNLDGYLNNRRQNLDKRYNRRKLDSMSDWKFGKILKQLLEYIDSEE